MVTDTDVVTFEAVAQWLPQGLRDSIVVNTPCPGDLSGRHEWDLYAVPMLGRLWWQCNWCHSQVFTDPNTV